MSFIETFKQYNKNDLTQIFNELKKIYNYQEINEERKNYIKNLVKEFGYLPYSHQRALTELTPAETLAGLEEKLTLNNIYTEETFNFEKDNISPIKRAGCKDSNWIKKEQHNIKLVNLAGLGDGNHTEEPGKFIDWLKQILILPSGKPEKGIMGTTVYLIPFHPREFGCAYLPKSTEVSPNLEDSMLKEKLNLDALKQVKLFLTLAQLCGHPTMFDVLPQTGRFSKIILSTPHAARWFDVKELIEKLSKEAEFISHCLKDSEDNGSLDKIKNIIINELSGKTEHYPEHLKPLYEKFNSLLDEKRKEFSNLMLKKENQEKLHIRAKKIINSVEDKDENYILSESEILKQDEATGQLIQEGLWPAPGGAWNSCGIPVFNKMFEGAAYPTFKHYNVDGEDVTHFANLDCQTPYYFVYLENGEFNNKVIDFYVELMKNLQKEYNFDGFRVDHIDHIVDRVSEQNGTPISYRAPKIVLGKANQELKKENPTFATLAEYMLWDKFYKEYHQDMNFDALWGNDIISQYQKSVERIIEDNQEIENYNSSLSDKNNPMTILKIYNNQDGEFREINQYPGQLGEQGALFKWFKLKLLTGGELAQRPVMYIDGDESFTETGIESVIGAEKSMPRNNHEDFYKKFNAINLFAISSDILFDNKARLIEKNNDNGTVSWIIEKNNEAIFVIANEKPPTEVTREHNGQQFEQLTAVTNHPVLNVEFHIPENYKISSEFILQDNDFKYSEKPLEVPNQKLYFEKLEPSEFHIYKLIK